MVLLGDLNIVHGIKDVLMHDMDDKVMLGSIFGGGVYELAEWYRAFVNITDHNHDEHVFENSLGDALNIYVVVSTELGNFCEDADFVFSHYGEYSLHGFVLHY